MDELVRMMWPVDRLGRRFPVVRFRLGLAVVVVWFGGRLGSRFGSRFGCRFGCRMVVLRRRGSMVVVMMVVIIPVPGNQGIEHQLAGGEE